MCAASDNNKNPQQQKESPKDEPISELPCACSAAFVRSPSPPTRKRSWPTCTFRLTSQQEARCRPRIYTLNIPNPAYCSSVVPAETRPPFSQPPARRARQRRPNKPTFERRDAELYLGLFESPDQTVTLTSPKTSPTKAAARALAMHQKGPPRHGLETPRPAFLTHERSSRGHLC